VLFQSGLKRYAASCVWSPDSEADQLGRPLANRRGEAPCPRSSRSQVGRWSSEDDYGFIKTVVPVRLAQYGNDRLISRSQAKRVLSRVELFKTVVFNFEGVPTIGQAFADEIFRVFANTHPQIELLAIRASSEVKRMIAAVKSLPFIEEDSQLTQTVT